MSLGYINQRVWCTKCWKINSLQYDFNPYPIHRRSGDHLHLIPYGVTLTLCELEEISGPNNLFFLMDLLIL